MFTYEGRDTGSHHCIRAIVYQVLIFSSFPKHTCPAQILMPLAIASNFRVIIIVASASFDHVDSSDIDPSRPDRQTERPRAGIKKQDATIRFVA